MWLYAEGNLGVVNKRREYKVLITPLIYTMAENSNVYAGHQPRIQQRISFTTEELDNPSSTLPRKDVSPDRRVRPHKDDTRKMKAFGEVYDPNAPKEQDRKAAALLPPRFRSKVSRRLASRGSPTPYLGWLVIVRRGEGFDVLSSPCLAPVAQSDRSL